MPKKTTKRKVTRSSSEVRLHQTKKVNSTPIFVYLGLVVLIVLFGMYIMSFFTSKPQLNMMEARPASEVISNDTVNTSMNTTTDNSNLNLK